MNTLNLKKHAVEFFLPGCKELLQTFDACERGVFCYDECYPLSIDSEILTTEAQMQAQITRLFYLLKMLTQFNEEPKLTGFAKKIIEISKEVTA